jgi:thioesterase domain-containing protein
VSSHLRELRTLPGTQRLPFLRDSARNAWVRARRRLWWWTSKKLYLDRGRPLPTRLNNPEALNQIAAHGYRTPSYGGKVTLFPASTLKRETGADRRLRWGEFARGGLEVREIDSHGAAHLTLLTEPHVRSLAAEMESAIRAALAEDRP